MRLGQSGERAADSLALLDLLGVGVGRGPLIDQDPVPVLLVDALGTERAPARRVLSRAVPRDVHHDPKEPGVERGVAPERRQRLKGADEGILGDVPGLFRVAKDVVGESIDALPVLLDQGLERREIAGTASLDQGCFVRVHRDSLARPPSSLDDEMAVAIHRRRVVRRESAVRASRPSR